MRNTGHGSSGKHTERMTLLQRLFAPPGLQGDYPDENNFLIVGMMCNVCVHTKPGDHRKVDFIRKEAGTYSDGQWRCRQRQNGDEKIVTMLYDMPECVKMELFKY